MQARIRGNCSWRSRTSSAALVLTTGNKSELAIGYCTLYGDMAGGFAVIKDVPKTLVYRSPLAQRARRGPVIPRACIDKPPSAELRPDQHDTDSLPPYEVLDPILEAYVEEDRASRRSSRWASTPAIVARVIALVDRNEYKRRQAPPGVKITPAPSAATAACPSPTATAI